MWYLLKTNLRGKNLTKFLFVLFLMIAQVALDIIIPLLLTRMNEVLIAIQNNSFTVGGYNFHNSDGGMHYALICFAIMIGVCLLELLVGMWGASQSAKLAVSVSTNIRNSTYRKIQSFSSQDVDKFKTSSIITRLTFDIQTIQNALGYLFRIGFRSILLCIGGIVGTSLVVTVMNPQTTNYFSHDTWSLPVLMIISSLALFVVLSFIIYLSSKYFKESKYATDEVNSVMRENILGVRVVKSFNLQEEQIERFDGPNQKLLKVSQKAFVIGMWMFPIINFMMSAIVVATLWLGSATQAITVANVGTLLSISSFVTLGMVMFIKVILETSKALSSAFRIKEILFYKEGIQFNENGVDIVEGTIEFKDVNFKYNENSEYVLKNINFKIAPNEFIGIIGPTGSGKSTLLSLIARLYDVKEGNILLSNQDIKNIKRDSLKKEIAIDFQNPTLFSGTIISNLKMANKNANLDEIIEICKGVEAYEFIQDKERGFESVVEQRGKNFSGGQKQRLSIARALLRKSKILLLDSSTSALDMITERKVNEYLKFSNHERTTILVGQRISTVKNLDKILVMDKGEIVGIGTHQELLRNCKEYYDIALSQLGEQGVKHELEI